jgi:hypothetical protein
MVQVGQSLSNPKSGPRFLMDSHFPVWKMVQFGQSLSSPESGLRFFMDSHFLVRKMVRNRQSWSNKLLMYHRHRFPLWPVWGNGLGQTFSLAVTLRSGQEEWSASPGSHSFKVHSCEQFRRMVRCRRLVQDSHFHRKWSGQSFPREDSFSPGCTMNRTERMAQLG